MDNGAIQGVHTGRDGGLLEAANETYDEIAAKNTAFKKLYDHVVAFRNEVPVDPGRRPDDGQYMARFRNQKG